MNEKKWLNNVFNFDKYVIEKWLNYDCKYRIVV